MKKYCFNCNKEVFFKKREEEREYSYRNKTFLVKEDIYYCSICGSELTSDDIDEDLEKIYNGYLKFYGLTLDSFLDIRKTLNLSQELFAFALGWSKKSIVRYENKEEIPSGEYLKTYMKLKEDKDYFWELLNLNKVNLNLDIKSRNVILFFLEDKSLYLVQLLKMLFASDFWCYKNTYKPITGFKYAKLPFGPVVDQYNLVLNAMLKSGEVITENILLKEGEKIKYKGQRKADLALFTKDEIKVMREVKSKLKNKTAKELSLWSHEFEGWKETEIGKIISYEKYAQSFSL